HRLVRRRCAGALRRALPGPGVAGRHADGVGRGDVGGRRRRRDPRHHGQPGRRAGPQWHCRGSDDRMSAFVTGAAQGLGRAICVALAEGGHDVIACDLASEDMSETVAAVEGTGRKIVTGVADVREQAQLDALVADGVAAFGGLDVVVANAGISNWSRFWEMPDEQWQRLIDINLTGVWRTFK